MTIDINQIIITLIQMIIAPLAIWLVKEAVAYLKTKAVAIQDTALHDQALYYIDLAAAAIEAAVAETQQVFVSTIKGTDGWSAEAAQEAYTRARTRAVEIMGIAVYDGLNQAVGDTSKWINAQIEAAVLADRQSK